MTRSISSSLAGVLEKLELERPTIVTTEMLSDILREECIQTPTRIVAARLREKGWLLPTLVRGSWEFVPAASAGAYSSNDPLLHVKSMYAKNPKIEFGLTFQSAAWAYGVAERVPSLIDVATKDSSSAKILTNIASSTVFVPYLPYRTIKAIPVLAPESIVVHMTIRPRAVRSWQGSLEWFPELAEMLKLDLLLQELAARNHAVISRTGYLIQGLRPDIADELYKCFPPKYKTWFGPHTTLLRHDNRWLIADSLLPFDPRTLEAST